MFRNVPEIMGNTEEGLLSTKSSYFSWIDNQAWFRLLFLVVATYKKKLELTNKIPP